MIKLYNSKGGEKQEFIPREAGKVTMYVCGPTVYNYIHIGNARPMITFDLLRRLLDYKGYEVTHISNFTDVDDKIINRAEEEGVSEMEIANKYMEAYLNDSRNMNIVDPNFRPKVTDVIPEIIEFIELLIKNEYAYAIDGDVYFRLHKAKDYGKISNKNIDDLIAGARIEANDKKEAPLDFTLWKATEKGLSWDSPWGKGRPGWHTECVVMIDNIAGPMIDIHGGGMDLKFPHHENEAAQAEGAWNTVLANYWVHNGFINLDGEKMSKSLGNVKWVKDILKTIDVNVFRLSFYQTHYLKPLNFSDDLIAQTTKMNNKILNVITSAKEAGINVEATREGNMVEKFVADMSDDMNISNAIATLLKTIKEINKDIRAGEVDTAANNYAQLLTMLSLLGLKY